MRKIIFLFLISSAQSCFGQSWQDTLQNLDKLFQSYEGVPGAQLAISRNGQMIFSKAWGLADMEHEVPLTTNSIMESGSIAKQFVAACILLLEQQDKLSLEDDVRKYLPELPDYGTPIKLRHMMQHTSGLRDWGAVAALTGWPRSTKTYDNNDALAIISRQKALNNVPGAEFIYSNSNYNLFAIIIERVSGLSLAKFSRQYIFDPVGMKLSEWRDDYKRIVKNRAIAYSPSGTGYQTEMPNEYVYGNGGMLTTAEELMQWTNYYTSGKLGSPSLREKQLHSDPLLNGNKNSYAGGLTVQTTNGWRDINHNGATAGYRTDMHHFPELGMTIAWMSNNARSMSVVNDVINLFVTKKPVTATKSPTAIVVSTATLNRYAGWYRDERSGEGVEISLKDSSLIIQNQKMIPTSSSRFVVGSNSIDFMNKGFRRITGSNDTIFFYSIAKAKIAEDALKDFVGRYFSEETDSKLSISLVNGKLVMKMKPTGEIPLTPTYVDGFTLFAGNAHVYFERGTRNKVTTMKISGGRARNIIFSKL